MAYRVATMERHELLAWLGDDWTPEQTEQIIEEYHTWERNNPDATEEVSEVELITICQRNSERVSAGVS